MVEVVERGRMLHMHKKNKAALHLVENSFKSF